MRWRTRVVSDLVHPGLEPNSTHPRSDFLAMTWSMVGLLHLSSVQVCILNSDQEINLINASFSASDLFVDKSKMFRNISGIDASNFVTYAWDSYRFDECFLKLSIALTGTCPSL
jgi:hypothetical protein